jgi:hypothetical protein
MFNYQAIDKTPTVSQIKAIIKYMEDEPKVKFNFGLMMEMTRPKPNEIHLDLNNAHFGNTYKITFNDDNEITSFKETGVWMS